MKIVMFIIIVILSILTVGGLIELNNRLLDEKAKCDEAGGKIIVISKDTIYVKSGDMLLPVIIENKKCELQ